MVYQGNGSINVAPSMPSNMSNLELPYTKDLGIQSGFHVYLVDVEYVRDKIDDEMAEYATHYSMKEVPKGEIWIADDVRPSEIPYWIRESLAEQRYCANGKCAEKSEVEAFKTEYSFRKHIKDVGKIKTGVYKKIGPITIWWVNGEAVRSTYNSDWQDGGHGYIYEYIPKNEIWLENRLHGTDAQAILLHEVHEMNRMRFQHWPYLKAHNEANKIEGEARKNPKLLPGFLDTEFKKAAE
jgi:hypothetical protein